MAETASIDNRSSGKGLPDQHRPVLLHFLLSLAVTVASFIGWHASVIATGLTAVIKGP